MQVTGAGEMNIVATSKKGHFHEKQKHKCIYPDCDWVFTCNYKLQRHLRSHTGEKPFECQQCKVKFSTQYNLLSHQKTHSRMKCSYNGCKEIFDTKYEEEKHVKDFHMHSFICPKRRCSEYFNSVDELHLHLSNHGKKYSCDFENCHKIFTKPSLLKQHMMTHSGELPFKCAFLNCNKGFATRQRLTRHTLIHENKKSFVCDVEGCGKRFNHLDYLKTHMRIHSSKKDFKCPVESCQRGFACSETLKVHMRRHNNIRPYKCSELNCGRSYLTFSNLRAHQKIHERGKCIRRRSIDMPKSKKEESNGTIESISVNEFLNVKVYEPPPFTKDKNSTECYQDLHQQNIAAKYGEMVCNGYLKTNQMQMNNQNIEEQIPSWNGEEVIPITSEGRSTDIDIQFQEEFVSDIYIPCSINNLGVFDSGHDYERTEIIGSDTNEALFLTSTDLPKLEHDAKLSDVETLELSMELSTGHLVIDGGYLATSTFMPDHIYSQSNSTVNLKDIQ